MPLFFIVLFLVIFIAAKILISIIRGSFHLTGAVIKGVKQGMSEIPILSMQDKQRTFYKIYNYEYTDEQWNALRNNIKLELQYSIIDGNKMYAEDFAEWDQVYNEYTSLGVPLKNIVTQEYTLAQLLNGK